MVGETTTVGGKILGRERERGGGGWTEKLGEKGKRKEGERVLKRYGRSIFVT